MIQNMIHHKYLECVCSFCRSIPPILQLTTEEIDAYFRSCAVYLWASSGQPEGIFDGINLLYTDSLVKLTQWEFEDQISHYRSTPDDTVGIPDFFRRMLAFDRASDTVHSRRFMELQSQVLTLCGEYDGAFTFSESRRMTYLYQQLATLCGQAGIGTVGSRANTPEAERDHMQELGNLVKKYCMSLSLSDEENEAPEINAEDGKVPE